MKPVLSSLYTLHVILPDTDGFLTAVSHAGIRIANIRIIDELTLTLQVNTNDYPVLNRIAQNCGGQVKILFRHGIYAFLQKLKRRAVLVSGIAMILFLTFYLPTRVLFITVEGNNYVDTAQILDVAEANGLGFGSSRKAIRSEKVKNALLQNIPGLKWAGINTTGCCAIISVMERQAHVLPSDTGCAGQGIYAERDGIVYNITVSRGTALCSPGQAVSSGQLLVSGYTDCNGVIRAECADGEVMAVTQRQIQGVYPNPTVNYRVTSEKYTAVKIICGKKHVNFNIGSGNSESECGKIYKMKSLTLPGGFVLPVSLVLEITQEHAAHDPAVSQDSEHQIKELADTYLTESMIAGKILAKKEDVILNESFWELNGSYTCTEMIGRLQKEEMRNFED